MINILTVRLGEARAGRVATPLLGFGAAGIGDEEGTVVGEVLVLGTGLLNFVGVLLEVSDEALSDGLAGSVSLRDLTTTTDGDVDLKAGEELGANDGDGFHNLGAERLGLEHVDGDSVDLDVGLGGLGDGGDGGGVLSLAEGLDAADDLGGLGGSSRSHYSFVSNGSISFSVRMKRRNRIKTLVKNKFSYFVLKKKK